MGLGRGALLWLIGFTSHHPSSRNIHAPLTALHFCKLNPDASKASGFLTGAVDESAKG